MTKIKLLIATAHLAQAGSERWVYEICKHINKERFSVTVLTDVNYTTPNAPITQKNYYHKQLLDLGISVIPGIRYEKKWPNANDYAWRARNLLSKLRRRKISFVTPAGRQALQLADLVCVIDAYLYEVIAGDLAKYAASKFFTILHCHQIQFAYDLYRGYEKEGVYTFGYFCHKQIEELAATGFNSTRLTLFYSPLLASVQELSNVYQPLPTSEQEPVIIGVFTRISPMKPLEPFIDAFVNLQKAEYRPCVLNLYGAEIDAEYGAQLRAYIKAAGLHETDVQFKGHVQNIAEAIQKDKVNIYWGIALNTSMGYASIEVGAMTVPSFFMNWDLNTDYRQLLEQSEGALHVHRLPTEMAEDVAAHLAQPTKLKALAQLQRQYLISIHETQAGIAAFELQMERLAAGM